MQGSMEERFRAAMAALSTQGEAALPQLEALYDPEMRFEDPLQTIDGRAGFMEMNRRLLRRSRSVKFDVRAVVEAGEDLLATWTMDWEPRMGPRMRIEGATHARLRDGRIREHRDYWDLLSSAAAAVPGLGPLYRRVVSLFA